ncbi:cellulose-binding domain-containing protein [Microbispora sp. CA-135349]|uniref:cellulose-binding domain-containing protein n=1 Tax=Microbispora sp. CA-135349 TaxID=3239953 RepID=UPI003D8A7A6E
MPGRLQRGHRQRHQAHHLDLQRPIQPALDPRLRTRTGAGHFTAPAPVLPGLPFRRSRAPHPTSATYTVSSEWPGGFGANVSVNNLGDPVNGWKLTWSFPAGQTVTQLWNGTYTQSGSQVTVGNVDYNSALSSGGSASSGFNGVFSGSNPVPSSFALNGSAGR